MLRATYPKQLIISHALAWLGGGDRRPVFAWVHLYDPHLPYEPPEPFARRFKDRPYEGEIAFMDAQVGRLLAALAARGRPTLWRWSATTGSPWASTRS